MKIGILTFHHSLNCGAALQAWALQAHLRKCGHNASIVNYGKIGWPCKYYLRCDSLRRFIGSFYKGFFTFFRTFAIESYRRHLYRRFMREQMALGDAVKKDEINKSGYTHLIVGSDQVWHSVINEGDDAYFLADVPDGVKRISYAPSFGVDEFDQKLEQKMAGWLARFDALSVREPQGAEIVKRLCGRYAAVVCDPTLLLKRADYEVIERAPRFGLPQKYIAVYTVCGHPWAESAAIGLGKKMGLPVVHLPGGQLARWYLPGKAKRVTALGPAEWLWFIHHAEYVVTNSFHGTVFSLVYHRPFTVALNVKPSDARMLSLLEGVGLISRVEHSERVDCVDVDWGMVDKRIWEMQKGGADFLADNLMHG
ncbi:MAG: polysaccharide pyruvyl transferase family protein [Kiritimatiellae bacterium]|nr:polysaccharide pyruvyl transferase family protein [Kiritimatiellia bacterium]